MPIVPMKEVLIYKWLGVTIVTVNSSASNATIRRDDGPTIIVVWTVDVVAIAMVAYVIVPDVANVDVNVLAAEMYPLL